MNEPYVHIKTQWGKRIHLGYKLLGTDERYYTICGFPCYPPQDKIVDKPVTCKRCLKAEVKP